MTLVTLDDAGKAMSYETFAEGWLQGESAWGRPADVWSRRTARCWCQRRLAGAIYRISYTR